MDFDGCGMAFDGLSKELFIVQVRAERNHSQKDHKIITEYSISHNTKNKQLY